MEQLRKIGQACGQHYEKFVLSTMLVLLAAAVWVLFQETQHEAEKLDEFKRQLVRGKVIAVKDVDLSANASLRQIAQNPPALTWVGTNNLFNPVKWQQGMGGAVIKVQSGREVGVEALAISSIRPLHFLIRIENPSSNGCYLTLTNEFALARRQARQQKFLSPSSLDKTNVFFDAVQLTNRFFVPRQVQGPPENPKWTLEMDSGERVVVSKDQPYVRVEGYEADLKYPLNNKVFSKLRVGTNYVIRLEGEDYKVVAINKAEVVLSGRLNEQLHTVSQMAPP